MRLLVVSYKVCWADEKRPGQFVSSGGFPQQMEALAEIFTRTRLLILEGRSPRPRGTMPLKGPGMTVTPLAEPLGTGWLRKLYLVPWILRNLPHLRRELGAAEAVHCLVPGDLGFLGLLICLASRKMVFVRHCGTWGSRDTLANDLLTRLLKRVAGGRTVVMATGGGYGPPEPSNPAITWIFSTSLRQTEFGECGERPAWQGGPLRLVTVGRLSRGKNTSACIAAVPAIRKAIPGTGLDIVGDGPERESLEDLATRQGVSDAVRFHGNLNHQGVLKTLSEGDLFLFPTRVAEGFPKAVLEAMACGLPVVAPKVSVLPFLIGQDNGVLLDSTEAEDVAEAVIRCAASPGQLSTMSNSARRTAGQFTLERWRDLIRERLEAAWDAELLSPRPVDRFYSGRETE